MAYQLPDKNQKIYFIGIGGAGMSAIAYVLLKMGYNVSGSDKSQNTMTARIVKNGGKVYLGHKSENVIGSDLVVISTAITPDNCEYKKALQENIPIWHRADMLSALMSNKISIAIAGTHGKTTTTSMTALLLEKSGLDPTSIIGGELEDIGGNSKLGSGKYLVAEADESDGSFLKMNPDYVIITNMEADHLDYYKTYDNIKDAFSRFIRSIRQSGKGFICYDDIELRKLGKELKRNTISYGIENEESNIMAKNIKILEEGSEFDISINKEILGKVRLNIPGLHNIVNSLGVIGVGLEVGIKFSDIAEILPLYRGVRRRFQFKGKVDDVFIYDDYAHHPTEIKATLKAAKNFRKGLIKRIVVIFQPHRYSRTFHLYQEFGKAFGDADVLILTDIYSAGESLIDNVNGELIYKEVINSGHKDVKYIPEKENISDYLLDIIHDGDLVITMGAGDICKVGDELVEKLAKSPNAGSV